MIELCEKLSNKVETKFSSTKASGNVKNQDDETKSNEIINKFKILNQNQTHQLNEL